MAQQVGMDVDMDELYDVDSCPLENAQRLTFAADVNEWDTAETQIRVAKRMFAYGPKNGCIRMKDVTTDEVMVLKKSFIREETVEDVYDTIKMQKLAALCCQLFCAKSGEQCQPQFLDACIYVLKQRPSMPKIRVEAVVAEPYDKRPLALAPATASHEDVVESHRFAAFQYFTYVQSGRGMVVTHAQIVQGLWTEPIIASSDRSLGGRQDAGADAILEWVANFASTYSRLLDVDQQTLMGLSPEEFVSVIDQRGLLGGPISMPPQAASSLASHASPNVDAEARARADAEELRRLEEARESQRLADESAAEEERLRTAARQREAFQAAEERRREQEARIAAEEQLLAATEGKEQEAEVSVAVESETSVLSRSIVVEEGPLAALKQKLRAYEQEFAKTAPTVPLSSSSVRVLRSPAPATGPTPGATPMDPGVVDASPAVAALSPGAPGSIKPIALMVEEERQAVQAGTETTSEVTTPVHFKDPRSPHKQAAVSDGYTNSGRPEAPTRPPPAAASPTTTGQGQASASSVHSPDVDPRRTAALASYAQAADPGTRSHIAPAALSTSHIAPAALSTSSIQPPPSWGWAGPPASVSAGPAPPDSSPQAPPPSQQQQQEPPLQQNTQLSSAGPEQHPAPRLVETRPPEAPERSGPSKNATWLEPPRPGYSVNLSKYASGVVPGGTAGASPSIRRAQDETEAPVVNWGFYRRQVAQQGVQRMQETHQETQDPAQSVPLPGASSNVSDMMGNMNLNGTPRLVPSGNEPGPYDRFLAVTSSQEAAPKPPKLYGFM